MKSKLERVIAEAAHEFAMKVASVIQKPSAPGEWVDQATCAPLSRRKFLSLVASGELSARAVGKQRLVRRRDLDRCIERHAPHGGMNVARLTDAQIEARVLADLDLTANSTKEKS